ncbi:enoyl-CoA hydratase/isomerase family protein [Alkalihalobacterium bogoriense]|uniref:enoyl-CoA hydratase/isomerase family protein n=1 Tax=Alkalihalobacterium bogoriense TaxID=246272 RepID=UPI00047AF2A6|nr:enoyl-CoA hydratase/isomerase family protein [Alkalihalobacterium bogoriense]
MEKKLIVVREPNGTVTVTINRPSIRNAIDYDVMDELVVVLDEVERHPEDKVLVITGQGEEAFCSGGDLSVFHSLHTKEEAKEMLMKMGMILYRLFFFPKVTVAAINGTAVGGGCELAISCDYRIAASHAKVGFVQGGLGITTGWGGSTFLSERIGATQAMKALLSCKRFNAEEAHAMRIIDSVLAKSNFKMESKEWISPLLHSSMPVLKTYKQRMLDRFDKENIKRRIMREIDECAVLWASEEHHEAVKKFLRKS